MEKKCDPEVKNGGIPPAVAEFAVEERQQLLGRIERLERFERAYNEWHDKAEWVQDDVNAGIIDASALGLHRADVITRLVAGLRNELSTLKAKSSGVPDKRCQCCGYLVTESEHRGCLRSADVSLPSSVVLPEQDGSDAQISFLAGFEFAVCGLHNSNIRAAWNDFKGSEQFKRLNSYPASAGAVDERAAFERWGYHDRYFRLRWERERYVYATTQREWEAWQARAALTASAPNRSEQVRAPDGWKVERGFNVLDKQFRFVDSKSHLPTIKIILPACSPEDMAAFDVRDKIADSVCAMLAAAPSAGSQKEQGE